MCSVPDNGAPHPTWPCCMGWKHITGPGLCPNSVVRGPGQSAQIHRPRRYVGNPPHREHREGLGQESPTMRMCPHRSERIQTVAMGRGEPEHGRTVARPRPPGSGPQRPTVRSPWRRAPVHYRAISTATSHISGCEPDRMTGLNGPFVTRSTNSGWKDAELDVPSLP